jgi:hypothetical protein
MRWNQRAIVPRRLCLRGDVRNSHYVWGAVLWSVYYV